MRNITTLLFDLGGVLIELGSLSDMMATSPHSDEDIWRGWTQSPSVRGFESGRCTPEEFAENMVNEFELSISVSEFIDKFRQWPKGTYPGAQSLLESLSGEFDLACLSNTNLTHWETFLSKEEVMTCFSTVFLSHQTGVLKPDDAAFRRVVESLGVAQETILFFDDNPGNVSAAKKMGMNAECTKTPEGVIKALNGLGLSI
jgi:HAD superfamily hydrolase (TIGR01509 family)